MTPELIIYHPSGQPKATVHIGRGSRREFQLMEKDCITLKFVLTDPVIFLPGDYIVVYGQRYELLDTYKSNPSKAVRVYDYEVMFHAQYRKFANKLMKLLPEAGAAETSWSYTSSIEDHVEQILRNMNWLGAESATYKYLGVDEWTRAIGDDVERKAVAMTYQSTNILDAISDLAKAYETEWWFDGSVLHFGKCQHSQAIDIELGNNSYPMQRSTSKESRATKLYVYGSSNNLASTYRKVLIFTNTSTDGRAVFDTNRKLRKDWFKPSYRVYESKRYKEVTIPSLPGNYSVIDDLTGTKFHSVSASVDVPPGDYIAKLSELAVTLYSDTANLDVEIMVNITKTEEGETPTRLKRSSQRLTFYRIGGNVFKLPDIDFTAVHNCTLDIDVLFIYFLDRKDTYNVETGAASTGQPVTANITIAAANANASFGILLAKDRYHIEDIDIEVINGECETIRTIHGAKFYGTRATVDNPIEIPTSETPLPAGARYRIPSLMEAIVPASYFSNKYTVMDRFADLATNSIVIDRLLLPESVEGGYLTVGNLTSEEEAIEDVVTFEDVYPKTDMVVENVYTETKTGKQDEQDGSVTRKDWTSYSITVPMFNAEHPFNEDYIIDGKTLQIKFIGVDVYDEADPANGIYKGQPKNPDGGKLTGLTFDVAYIGDNRFEIQRDNNLLVPNEILKPSVGDKFILLGFNIAMLSDSDCDFIGQAEQELLRRANEYVEKLNTDANVYNCTMMCDWALENYDESNGLCFTLGQRVNLICPSYFLNGRESRVIGWEIPLGRPYDNPVYVVGEKAQYSRIGEISDKIENLSVTAGIMSQPSAMGGNGGGQNSAIAVIKSGESTPPSDASVYSSQRSSEEFLSKVDDDRAQGVIKFDKHIEFGGYTQGSAGAYVGQTDNGSLVETDYLYVRKRVKFDTMDIAEVKTIGGKLVVSPGEGVEITWVEDHGGTWVCGYTADQQDADGSVRRISGRFRTDDQIYCRVYNARQGINALANRYWWRRCTAAADGWFAVSKNDCAAGSDAPMVGDRVAQLGNRTNPLRQSAIILSAVEDDVNPMFAMYSGVDSYTLDGKESVAMGASTYGRAFLNVYGNAYIGGRDLSTYIRYTTDNGIEVKANEVRANRVVIGEAVLTYENGALHISKGVYSDAFVTALGLGSGSSGGGGGGVDEDEVNQLISQYVGINITPQFTNISTRINDLQASLSDYVTTAQFTAQMSALSTSFGQLSSRVGAVEGTLTNTEPVLANLSARIESVAAHTHTELRLQHLDVDTVGIASAWIGGLKVSDGFEANNGLFSGYLNVRGNITANSTLTVNNNIYVDESLYVGGFLSVGAETELNDSLHVNGDAYFDIVEIDGSLYVEAQAEFNYITYFNDEVYFTEYVEFDNLTVNNGATFYDIEVERDAVIHEQLEVYGLTTLYNDLYITSGKRIYFGDTDHYLELTDDGFHFSHGVYSDGFMTALGLGSSSSSGQPAGVDEDAVNALIASYVSTNVIPQISSINTSLSAQISSLTTTDIPEGANQYYTDAKVRNVVTKAYVDGLGIQAVAVGNNYRTLTFTKPDKAGKPVYILVADVTAWANNPGGTGTISPIRGIEGIVLGERNGVPSGVGVGRIVAMVSHSNPYYRLRSDSDYIKPRIVTYQGAYYIALYMTGGGNTQYFLGYKAGVLGSFITLECDANGNVAGLSVIHDCEGMPHYGNATSADKLYTARTLWGKSFNGTANVSGDMTGIGKITMNGDISGAKNGSFSGTLTVDGDVTAKASLSVTDNVSVGEALTVADNLTVGGTTTLNNPLIVNDTTTLNGNITVNADLEVQGDADFGNLQADQIQVNSGLYIKSGKRIYFGDSTHYLEYTANGFHFSHGVYSDSFMTALGVGSASTPSAGVDEQAVNQLIADYVANNINPQIANITSRINNVQASLTDYVTYSQHQAELSALYSSVSTSIGQLGGKVGALETTVDNIEPTLANLSARIESVAAHTHTELRLNHLDVATMGADTAWVNTLTVSDVAKFEDEAYFSGYTEVDTLVVNNGTTLDDVSVMGTLGVVGAATINNTLKVTNVLTANGGVVIPSGKTLKIGDAILSWQNNALHISEGMYSDKFITALGLGSSSSAGQAAGVDEDEVNALIASYVATNVVPQINGVNTSLSSQITSVNDSLTALSSRVGSLTTSDIPEGSRLYFTNARVTGLITKAYVTNLGLDQYLSKNRTILTAEDDTPANWYTLRNHVAYYNDAASITMTRPSKWGFIANYYGSTGDVHQLWMTQRNGSIYHRGGNSNGWGSGWVEVLDGDNFGNHVTASYIQDNISKACIDNLGVNAASVGYYKTLTFEKPDKAGKPVYILVADVTAWANTPSGTGNASPIRGIEGVICGTRNGVPSGVGVGRIVAMVSHSNPYYRLRSDSDYIQPRIVTYQGSTYLALYMTGGGNTQYFLGYTSGELASFITLTCESDGSCEGVSVVHNCEGMPHYGNATSAGKLYTARTLWGQSFNGTANVSGDMTGVGSITMNGALSGATNGSFSGELTVTNKITAGEIVTTSGNDLRLRRSKYSVILRNDNTYLWTLLTAENDPDGTWRDTYSPFRIKLVDGSVSMSRPVTMGSTLGVAQTLTASGTINANNGVQIAANKRIYFSDTSHYLELTSDGFHFSHGVYSDSFVSALGLGSSASSSGGVDESAVNSLIAQYAATNITPAISNLSSSIAGLQSTLSTLTTDDVAEGTSRKYYTDARVRGVVTKAYVDGLGIAAASANTATSAGAASWANQAGSAQTAASASTAVALLNSGNSVQIGDEEIRFNFGGSKVAYIGIEGDLYCNNEFHARGDSVIGGDLVIGGALSVSGSIYAEGGISTDGGINAAGAITSESSLTVYGTIYTDGTIYAEGDITTDGDISAADTISAALVKAQNVMACNSGDRVTLAMSTDNSSYYRGLMTSDNVAAHDAGYLILTDGVNTALPFGNVVIGSLSAYTDKLTVQGSILATGGIVSNSYITALGQNTSSDMRLKTDIRDLDLSVGDIAALPAVAYRWKATGEADIGTIAQAIISVLPLCVRTDRDGYLTVDYGKAALASVITVARTVERLEGQVAELTEKITALECENADLKRRIMDYEYE